MPEKDDRSPGKMAAVLIPVVVGSLLGLIASLTTSYFNFHTQQKETIRQERNAHLERAMTLTLKYSNDIGKALSLGIITKGEITPKEMAILHAPTDTLTELSAVIQLYFPELIREVDQVYVASRAMMQRFDDIIDFRGQHRGEDAASFNQRIQKEVAVVVDRVQSLRGKLSKLANDSHR